MHGIAIKTLTPILSFLSSKNPKERMRDNMDLKVHIQERLPKKKKKRKKKKKKEKKKKRTTFQFYITLKRLSQSKSH
jgi:hypothetical protein